MPQGFFLGRSFQSISLLRYSLQYLVGYHAIEVINAYFKTYDSYTSHIYQLQFCSMLIRYSIMSSFNRQLSVNARYYVEIMILNQTLNV